MTIEKLINTGDAMAGALSEIIRAAESAGNDMKAFRRMVADYHAVRDPIVNPEYIIFSDETCAEVPAFARRQSD